MKKFFTLLFCSLWMTATVSAQGNDTGYAFADKEGNVFIDFLFDAASYFEWGRAEVVYNSEVFKINPEGKCVKNCKKFPKIELWPR